MRVPLGETADEKLMFDNWVFEKRSLNWDRDEQKLVQNLKNHIKEWRKRKN